VKLTYESCVYMTCENRSISLQNNMYNVDGHIICPGTRRSNSEERRMDESVFKSYSKTFA